MSLIKEYFIDLDEKPLMQIQEYLDVRKIKVIETEHNAVFFGTIKKVYYRGLENVHELRYQFRIAEANEGEKLD